MLKISSIVYDDPVSFLSLHSLFTLCYKRKSKFFLEKYISMHCLYPSPTHNSSKIKSVNIKNKMSQKKRQNIGILSKSKSYFFYIVFIVVQYSITIGKIFNTFFENNHNN